ncbi:MAG: glucose-6-phosphate dehydrogenase [Pseudomonadota bacterium]
MENINTPTKAPKSIIVIFGAAGDLTKRKLIPALYHLMLQGLLSKHTNIIGVDRLDIDSETYRNNLSLEIKDFIDDEFFSQDLWDQQISKAHYMQGDFREPQTYKNLEKFISKIDNQTDSPDNCLFYCATPPSFFGEIATQLGNAGFAKESEKSWRRIIIEKPFGRDLESARELNKVLHNSFQEHQIYRIDHYLGKETVQNIMAYRFGNGTIEPIWNHRYIDHIQITVSESLGVEDRASYYEEAGAMRDMIANHLLALLSIIAMEPPNSFDDADAIRDEQTKVLKAIEAFTPEQVLTHAVRGQYGQSTLENGEQLEGYRNETGVLETSGTETFVALKLMIDSWRWSGVPFYIRTGKRMPGRYTEVVIQYKYAPSMMFHKAMDKINHLAPNRLILRIQPDEGISLQFNAKKPGTLQELSTVDMDFSYSEHFGNAPSTGYETLIYDCLCGDATLFKRADNIEASWSIVQPILDVWQALPARSFPNYKSNSWGPVDADALLRRDNREWRKIKI